MLFTSYDFVIFFALVLSSYWLLRRKNLQNIMLLAASYIFYGFVHPWFCILIAISTFVDYLCGLAFGRFTKHHKVIMVISLVFNLGFLGTFKYFNFFAENFQALFLSMGFNFHPIVFSIYLPVGISFYTFQSLSYTIDVYRGILKPCRNLIDFALFVSFFPQLVAGPVERAVHLLPQVQSPRRWNWSLLFSAAPLLITGFMKKMVIADNAAIYADKVFMLHNPSLPLLFAGTAAFALQIYADFSGYTDIARGSAHLLGFDLMENFKSPYLSISPSDFWRRWHISFSSWIRDYLYIPLGGSHSQRPFHFFSILMVTMGLAGFWHGASWHFFAWGIYHGLLVFIYHRLGCGGHWQPATRGKTVLAWAIMLSLTLFGWLLFRASSMTWLLHTLQKSLVNPFDSAALVSAVVILLMVLFYSLPLAVLYLLQNRFNRHHWLHAIYYGLALVMIIIFARDTAQDFIYFQF